LARNALMSIGTVAVCHDIYLRVPLMS
jgi:hypothetical protein